MTEDTRPTGVKLHLLDTDAVLASINGRTGQHHSVSFAPYAVAERDGRMFVVCAEGVGWPVTETEPLELDIYTDRPGYVSILPTHRVLLGPARVRELTTEVEVDLADHIRRFGARLEGNFWSWYRRLAVKAGV